jgi:hypothetical protein
LLDLTKISGAQLFSANDLARKHLEIKAAPSPAIGGSDLHHPQLTTKST